MQRLFALASPQGEAHAQVQGLELSACLLRCLRPREAFRADGPVRAAAAAFRDRGNKLHTRAFNSYPQRGDGGANYCDYIIHRHAHFAEIGLAAYDLVAAPGGVSLAALDACYRGFDRIGPTMSKVLLVTNHLWRPHLNILGDDCEVGDGADEAFTSSTARAAAATPRGSGASATSSTTSTRRRSTPRSRGSGP